ncbi:hypothetical protein B0H10DRAFT_1938102 [Mycena sp. CBHHK59/15]|nr:hypothetical protein B0H10DRAFT_1938102 [Mycena sp. CBHHK59/15]
MSQNMPQACSCLICCAIDTIDGVTGPKKVTGSMLTVPESQLPTTQYCTQYVTQEVNLLVHQHPQRGLETYSVWEDGGGKLSLNGDSPDHRTQAAKKILPKRYHNVFDSTAVMFVEYQDLQDADEHARVQLGVTLTPTDMLDDDTSGLGVPCLPGTAPASATSVASPKPSNDLHSSDRETAQAPSLAVNIKNTYRVFEALVHDLQHSILFSITVGILAQGALVKTVVAMRADVSHA